MALETFHPFPRLPKELRDAIWELALRPERWCAHFFTAFKYTDDAEWAALRPYGMRVPDPYGACNLAAPQPASPGGRRHQLEHFELSWAEGNRSAYLIDSGLWTACRESRQAMQRRFTGATRDAPGWFTSNGEWRGCFVDPRTDLFLLRPHRADTIDWERSDWAPIEDRAGRSGHIAVEYDPEWLEADTGQLPRGASGFSEGTLGWVIRAATDQLWWARCLWIVDYGIRRKPGTEYLPATERYQFHGNGCVFTEVERC